LAFRMQSVPLVHLKESVQASPPPLDFIGAVQRHEGERVRVIAEVKKASPSKGVIREDFDPEGIAREYEKSGASAISVLTEEDFFQGHPVFLSVVRKSVRLPLLRKDFLIDSYQVWEARALGADAFLLIVSLLSTDLLEELILLGRDLGMAALVEVHTENELERALSSPARIIGVNNRDLKTFVTDLNTTFKMKAMMEADRIVVSESGIRGPEDLARLEAAGVDAVLVGETLMRSPHPGRKLQELLRYRRAE
jgi:indole-3-glycerol phosphate synthase